MNTINKFFGLLCVLLVFTACNEDPTYFTLENQPDDMHLQASVTELTLSKAQEDESAVTFKWNTVKSPIENYDSITYALRFYATDSKNEHHSDFFSLGGAHEVSFTHKDLNAIVARWVPAGTSIAVTAELVGTVNNQIKYIKPEVSKVEFRVTGYEKNPTYLYAHIKDDATGAERVERMSQRQLGTGIYEATLSMKPCTYYFTTSTTDAYPAYGQDTGGKVKFIDNGNVQPFTNTVTGKRTIIVDTNDDFMDCRVLNIV